MIKSLPYFVTVMLMIGSTYSFDLFEHNMNNFMPLSMINEDTSPCNQAFQEVLMIKNYNTSYQSFINYSGRGLNELGFYDS